MRKAKPKSKTQAVEPEAFKPRLAIPALEVCTEERLTEIFTSFARQLVVAGLHGPHLAKALERAGVQLGKDLLPVPVGHIAPAPAYWHDQIAREVSVAYVPEWPSLACMLITMTSGRTVPVQMSISDMRLVGERLIAEASQLAVLQVAAEKKR